MLLTSSPNFFRSLAAFSLLFAVESGLAQSQQKLEKRIDMNRIRLEKRQARPSTAIPPHILKAAKGIVILNQVKAGFVIGAEVGNGVAMVRNANGSWSAPAFISLAKGSWGLQIGADNTVTFMLLMTDESLNLLRGGNTLSAGVGIEAIAGPVSAGENFGTTSLRKPVFIYSSSAGAFAGASLEAGAIAGASRKNRQMYDLSMDRILFGGSARPSTQGKKLIETIEHFSKSAQ